MENNKVYVIMEVGWEYDDQYYLRVEGGSPALYYTKKEQADTACAEMNAERRGRESANDYYDCEDVSELDFFEVVEVKLGD